MINFKNVKFWGIFLFIMILFPSCNFQTESGNLLNEKQAISVVTWNTQTFFDGNTQGTEYSQFQKEKNWNLEKYKVRLSRLCEILEALNADIFILQEIENKAILQDLSNMMAGNSWNKKQLWPYACFAKEKNQAIGCGIISKYPISKIATHSLNIQTEKDLQPSMRPIIQATINVGVKDLDIFVNHWKSKSGGEEESQCWRKWQESVLASAINKFLDAGGKYCIAAGDFNMDIREFNIIENPEKFEPEELSTSRKANVVLKGDLLNCKNVEVYSPWLLENGDFSTEIGSYFFREKWERIDNIFGVGEIKVVDFCPKAEAPWAGGGGIPVRYNFYNGEGYSDHLPLMCKLIF